MNEITRFFTNNSNELIETQVFNDIIGTNQLTKNYYLKLTDNDVKEIMKTRKIALKRSGRIEFNGEIITKLIENFCDSPYISQFNYSDTINELVEIFYNYKNETLDMIGDDELIEIMK